MRSMLFILPLLAPVLTGCALISGNAIRVSGKALSVKTEMPEHVHVQVDGQCLACLRHISEDLTDRINTLEVQLGRYAVLAEQTSARMVEKLTAKKEALPSRPEG